MCTYVESLMVGPFLFPVAPATFSDRRGSALTLCLWLDLPAELIAGYIASRTKGKSRQNG